SLKSDKVQPVEPGAISRGAHVWRNIEGDCGLATDNGIGPDSHELVNGHDPPDNSMVADNNMPTKCDGVRHNNVVAQFAVMGYMRIGHEKILVSDYCLSVFLGR